MRLEQVRRLFADEIVEWKPAWRPERKLSEFSQFNQTILLNDGAKISAKFTSPVNGSQLYSFGYVQNLEDGPSVDQLKADLKAKYGEPDDVDWRGNVWTYHLVSKRPKRVSGAYMRIRYLPHSTGGDATVTYLAIAIVDAGLGYGDESDAYQAKLAAKRAAIKAQQEKEKSNRVKF
jgi:hypothetical protein